LHILSWLKGKRPNQEQRRSASALAAAPPTAPTHAAAANLKSAQMAPDLPTSEQQFRWYTARDAAKNITQVVVKIPPNIAQASEFGTLLLSPDKYPIVLGTWCATFFRLDNRPGPYLLVRADEFAAELRSLPMSVGFSFFKFDVGGLFVIFVRIQNDALLPKLRRRFPEIEVAAIEGVHGLDDRHAGTLIESALGRGELHVVVAANGGSVMESYDLATGQSRRASAPDAQFDIRVPIPVELRGALGDEWRALLAHHSSVPAQRRNWNAIQQRYGNVMPLSAEPILAEKDRR